MSVISKNSRCYFFDNRLVFSNKGDFMYINEYGNKNEPVIVLLAPMMVSGEELYQLMHPYFKEKYHNRYIFTH